MLGPPFEIPRKKIFQFTIESHLYEYTLDVALLYTLKQVASVFLELDADVQNEITDAAAHTIFKSGCQGPFFNNCSP